MNWNYRALAFVVTCLSLFAVQPADAASLILNGNVESWSSPTSLNNWASAGGNATQLTGQNSPFTDVAPLGNNAAQLSPGNNGYVQNFTAQTGVLQTTLEFKFDSLPTNGNVYHWGIDDGATTAFRLALGANFGKYTANTTGIVDILPLSAGTWYQVFVNADTTSQTISGGIRPFGGQFTTFTQAFSQPTATLSRAQTPIYGFIGGTNPDTPIIFDNIYVGPVLVTVPPPPAPEPASLVMLGLGGILLLGHRRRMVRPHLAA